MAAPPPPGTLLAAPAAAGVLVPALVAEAAAALQEELADGHGRHGAQPPPRHGRRQAAAGGMGRAPRAPPCGRRHYACAGRGGSGVGSRQRGARGTVRVEEMVKSDALVVHVTGSIVALHEGGASRALWPRSGGEGRRDTEQGRHHSAPHEMAVTGGPPRPSAHPACFLQNSLHIVQ